MPWAGVDAAPRVHSVLTRVRCLVLVACGGMTLGGAAYPASLAFHWAPPADVSRAGESSYSPDVGIDSRGDAFLVWGAARSDGRYVVMASEQMGSRRAWPGPTVLAQKLRQPPFVKVAVDARGDALAVWDSGHAIHSAYKEVGHGWAAPLKVSPSGQIASEASVAMDSHGQAVVAWIDTASGAVYSADWTASSRSWRRPRRLSTQGAAVLPQVAMNSRGDAAVVWKEFVHGSAVFGATYGVEVALRSASQARWQHASRIGTEVDGPALFGVEPGPQVAMDARGQATVVWEGPGLPGSSASQEVVIQSSVISVDGSKWQGPANVSSTAGWFPSLALDPVGDAVLVWLGTNGVDAAKRSARGGWRQPVEVSTSSIDYEPDVAISRDGTAIAIWTHQDSRGYDIQAAISRTSRDSWSLPVALSRPGENAGDPHVAAVTGYALAVWQRPLDHDGIIVQAAGTHIAK